MSEIETACWRKAHLAGSPRQRSAERLCVTCWPIHEPHWKREFVRTQLPELQEF